MSQSISILDIQQDRAKVLFDKRILSDVTALFEPMFSLRSLTMRAKTSFFYKSRVIFINLSLQNQNCYLFIKTTDEICILLTSLFQ